MFIRKPIFGNEREVLVSIEKWTAGYIPDRWVLMVRKSSLVHTIRISKSAAEILSNDLNTPIDNCVCADMPL